MTKLFDYQKDGVKQIEKFDGRVLLADEMGLGKTIQALYYHKRNKKGTTVVICPASVKYNWAREASIHIGEHAEILEGRKPPTREVLQKNKFIILNYEIVGGWIEYLKKLKPDILILDECHYVKNRKAKRTKCVKQLAKLCPHVLALSGTPLTNRPSELWTVLNMICPKTFKSFMPYAMKYCDAKRNAWGWEFKGHKNLGELHDILRSTCMIRRKKKDVLKDLPEKSRYVIPVELLDRKEYDEAENDLISWLSKYSKQKASAAQRAERLVKMGYLKRLAGESKVDSVIEWIERFLYETDEKLVVFGIHKNVMEKLKSKFPNSVSIDGSTKSKDRQLNVDKFQKDSKTRLFFGNIQAAGVGLTLTASSTVLFAELGWTPSEHSQAEDRIHRIGQTNVSTCYYMIGINTIEEKLSDIIQSKQDILSATLDGGKIEGDLNIYDQLQKEILR